MAENENTNITPEHTLTDEEIAAQDQARKAAEAARLAPFRALRRKMDAGLRYAVANDGVTDEELLTMQAVTPEWKPGIGRHAAIRRQHVRCHPSPHHASGLDSRHDHPSPLPARSAGGQHRVAAGHGLCDRRDLHLQRRHLHVLAGPYVANRLGAAERTCPLAA